MLSVQNLLPKLPVPKLGESLARYLRAVRPIVSNDEYANTERAVADFVNSGIGPKLQSHLEQRALKHENWLSHWWLHAAYLEYRDPLVLFSSPSFYWPAQKFSGPDDQFRFASSIISSALDYRTSIVKHELKPEVVGKDRKLCMAQFATLFDGCRIPALPSDKMLLNPNYVKPNELSKSVDVGIMYRNKFYTLKVDTRASDPQSIFNTLIALRKHENDPLATPVGMLTAWDRDNWAVAHEKLEKADPINAATLEAIRHCAILICLDTQPQKPVSSTYNLHMRSFENILHGGGSAINTGNRWFDKTVQFAISHDGLVGFCQEHAPCEALPTVSMSDYVGSKVLKNPERWRSLKQTSETRNLKQHDFKLTPELEKSIQEATKATDKLINDMETYVHDGPWGRDDAKKLSLSADSLFHMGLQVAYYRCHGKAVSVYETGSTRRFLLGRTDTIRPTSVESLALSKEMSNKQVDVGKAKDLLLKAIAAHQEYSTAVLNARAFDRHFLGLKRTAQELGIPLPALFTEPGYSKAMHHTIATSQVSSTIEGAGMGYGPLQRDGYGCCYNIGSHHIRLTLSAWRSFLETDPRRLGTVAAESLDQLYKIAAVGSKKSASSA